MRRSFTTRLLLALVVVLAVGVPPAAQAARGAGTTVAPALGPDGDAFYTPPSPLPAGRPGDVIRFRPLAPKQLGASAPPARGYLVMYLSRNAAGAPNAVTGTILVPLGRDPATVPIVGVAPGTLGMGDQCAASKSLAKGLLFTEFYLDAMLRRGWAVAVTDYEGLGTPGDHTYVVGQSTGRSLIDAVRAAQRLPAAGLTASAAVGFYGYSEGGGAAAWAAQLQPRYAPELSVVGVAAGGVPADLYVIARSLDGTLAAALLGYAAIGLNASYPDLRLDSYLSPYGKKVITALRTSCTPDGLTPYAFTQLRQLVTTDPLTTAVWQRRLAQNSLGRQAPGAPVFLWHGVVDQVLPFTQAVALHRAWCGLGAQVVWRPFVAEHVTGAIGSVDALAFLADRFAGRPVQADCARKT
ncbi:lipase family protein [Cryptosporangium aurantiacum]|uniref:Secretory lipase n=1 Tax=Cryptosporangium aurantiacum TaxID=134849 RepID=A0A1M7P8V1_9ACTN|nr:lipase family protein [Cryptosporangium aurantiacum]SHN13103.1 Secretory lipase [Cryptosporangium aurantiacum]